jgi:hypothetical protein
MYKNFNLTESEKEEILKKHKSYGYGKPLKEQYNEPDMDGEEIDEPDMDGEEIDEPDMDGETPSTLKLDSNVYVDCEKFTLFFMEESGGEAYVMVRIANGELVDIKITHNETDVNDDEIMNMAKTKISQGLLKNFPELITWNMESDECSTNQ